MKLKWWLVSLLVCLAIAALAPLASSSPDGLERVAAEKGFIEHEQGSPFHVIADYLFPGIQNETLGTMVAGFTGTVVLFGLAYGVAFIVKRQARRNV